VDGQVVCWGLNTSGQIGQGDTVDQYPPMYVKGLEGVVSMTAGNEHNCALDIDERVWCWGDNASGQIGNGTTENALLPVKVDGLPDRAIMVTSGENYTCSLLANQEVWCWGEDGLGQLNDGSTDDKTTPVKSMMSEMVYQKSAGQSSLLVGTLNGLGAWSNNESTMLTTEANVMALSADKWGSNGCAVVESADNLSGTGNVHCWGSDMVAKEVSGLMPAFYVSTASTHTCVINSDQTVSCWGSNAHGELGNNSTTDASSAVLVSSLSQVSDLVVGMYHTCAVVGANRIVECWGDISNGLLGGGSAPDSTVPVIVAMP
jgi:alpha-tubulin suppressor-like RCC1 family protein